jgi:hypothetical protein
MASGLAKKGQHRMDMARDMAQEAGVAEAGSVVAEETHTPSEVPDADYEGAPDSPAAESEPELPDSPAAVADAESVSSRASSVTQSSGEHRPAVSDQSSQASSEAPAAAPGHPEALHAPDGGDAVSDQRGQAASGQTEDKDTEEVKALKAECTMQKIKIQDLEKQNADAAAGLKKMEDAATSSDSALQSRVGEEIFDLMTNDNFTAAIWKMQASDIDIKFKDTGGVTATAMRHAVYYSFGRSLRTASLMHLGPLESGRPCT